MTGFPDKLITGFHQFRSGQFAKERKRYRALIEKGQKPQTMVIACCDSRAAPEIIFNTPPGELFMLRNVANLVQPYCPDGEYDATSAALEFAVQSLKVKHIVIMGHSRCGGIQAALAPAGEPLSPDDFIGKWMDPLTSAARTLNANDLMTDAERQIALERISIRNSIENLRTFPHIAAAEAKECLILHGAWFDIAAGELWIMDPATGHFNRLRSDNEADEE